MDANLNLVRIKAVHNALGALADKMVFIGGATASLYADMPAIESRPTDDVDVIVEIMGYAGEARLDEQLREQGFVNAAGSNIRCRYLLQGIVVDVMSTQPGTYGFTNRWYPDGFRNAVTHRLDERCSVKILTAPYFIATKLEAFKSRGKNDGRQSRDFEDIVFVLENRNAVWNDMAAAPSELRDYLKKEFRKLLSNRHITEWIEANVSPTAISATHPILENMERFVTNK